MGQVVGVSESTVVRFATHLGYKGYPEFQKALEEMVRNKLNSIQRMEVTYGRISQSHILETVLQSDQEKIKDTLEHIDEHAFELAVDTIIKAKHIYIVGIRSCAPLAAFMAFYFNLMCMKKQGEVAKTLETLEDIWNEYQVYENDEINYIDDKIKMRYAKLGDADE